MSEAVPSIGQVNPAPADAGPAWERLRDAVGLHASALCAVRAAGPGCCAVCRGPARAGYTYCSNCALHRQYAPGLLADLVAPISYSITGTGYADALWRYKSGADGRHDARVTLRLILLVFLHDHGQCLWSRARVLGPTHVAVVPSGRGRPGPPPIRALAGPCLALPWVDLAVRSGDPVMNRDLQAGRFRAAVRLTGASVLLLDDTWTSGASAQSAAAALKLAGATSVVTVILGRHLNPRHPGVHSFTAALATRPFRRDSCAVHTSTGKSD
jgi:hypothetical protein